MNIEEKIMFSVKEEILKLDHFISGATNYKTAVLKFSDTTSQSSDTLIVSLSDFSLAAHGKNIITSFKKLGSDIKSP